MQIKLIFKRKVSHLASILNREFLELGNRRVGLDSIETRSDDITKTTFTKFCVG